MLVTGTQSYPARSYLLYDKYVYAPIADNPIVVPVDEVISRILRPMLSIKVVEMVVATICIAIMMMAERLGSSCDPESLKIIVA